MEVRAGAELGTEAKAMKNALRAELAFLQPRASCLGMELLIAGSVSQDNLSQTRPQVSLV